MDTVLEFDTYDQLYSKSKLIMWLDISTYCNASCPQCHRTRAGYRHHYEKDENGNYPLWDDVKHNFRGGKK